VIVLCEVQIALGLARHHVSTVIATGYALLGLGWLVVGVDATLATVVLATLVVTAGEMLYKPTATATIADAAPSGFAGRYQTLVRGGVHQQDGAGAPARQNRYEVSPRGLWLVAAAAPVAAGAALAGSSRGRGRSAWQRRRGDAATRGRRGDG
jgi:dipeptide/tripeptide permease